MNVQLACFTKLHVGCYMGMYSAVYQCVLQGLVMPVVPMGVT